MKPSNDLSTSLMPAEFAGLALYHRHQFFCSFIIFFVSILMDLYDEDSRDSFPPATQQELTPPSPPASSTSSEGGPGPGPLKRANLCTECRINMGSQNPRQLCGKTVCLSTPLSQSSTYAQPATSPREASVELVSSDVDTFLKKLPILIFGDGSSMDVVLAPGPEDGSHVLSRPGRQNMTLCGITDPSGRPAINLKSGGWSFLFRSEYLPKVNPDHARVAVQDALRQIIEPWAGPIPSIETVSGNS